MDLFDADSDRPRRSNFSDGWWDRLTAGSPLWSADGSSAREHFPIIDPEPRQDTSQDGSRDGSDDAPRAGRDRARSSWVLVGSLRESAQGLALAPLSEDVDVCLAEAEDLLFARDRITCALADRVGRVHGAGRAKQHGHASTRSWLRTAAGMSVAGAGRLLTLAVELARLPRVREKFAAGQLPAGVVEAICAATANLSDEHAGVAEPILLELAGKAGAAEVAKAGRYLRAVLDPDGEDRDERAEYGRRFLRVRPGRGGGLEGEFSLPREAAARLRALLDAYAKPRAEGDDRPLSVRQADAFIALLEQKIATELLVLVNAESLPTDPAATTDHPADPDHAGSTDDIREADDAVPGDAGGTDDPDDPDHPATAEAETEADAGARSDASADGAADADAGNAGRSSAGPCDEEAHQPGPDERETCEDGTDERGTGRRAPRERGAGEWRTGECEPRDTASAASAESDDTPPVEGEHCDRAATRTGATHARQRGSEWPADGPSDAAPSHAAPSHAAPSHAAPSHAAPSNAAPSNAAPSNAAPPVTAPSNTAPSNTAPSGTAPSEAAQPDPPPEDAFTHHTHAGHQPAGDCRHAQTTSEDHSDVRCGQYRHDRGRHQPNCHEPGGKEPGRGEQGRARQDAADGQGACRCGRVARCACATETTGTTRTGTPGTGQAASPGTPPGTPGTPGALFGTAPGALRGTVPGALFGTALGTVPGLLLATGQMLPVTSVHRLARTSTLVRLVMDAQGQVLDMGRKVRLATPAQRRAIFARYATCWIDGCPLPATMCQIDHADNWSTGGLTDLKLLGPACQFHNRDRYQHPHRYTRRQTGTDCWTFTYHRLGATRLRV
ncbi:HNH endonuclease signature motif containing protein [Microbispora rosea]|uniref:HNH endonuclease signature motif containing protein n=1 Tax=Microbispora rosea TaxID=58117 RepID=UPI003438DC66